MRSLFCSRRGFCLFLKVENDGIAVVYPSNLKEDVDRGKRWLKPLNAFLTALQFQEKNFIQTISVSG